MPAKKQATEQGPVRVVAFNDDSLVRLTCIARVEDGDPNPGWAVGYALMRLVETFGELKDLAKAEAEKPAA